MATSHSQSRKREDPAAAGSAVLCQEEPRASVSWLSGISASRVTAPQPSRRADADVRLDVPPRLPLFGRRSSAIRPTSRLRNAGMR